MKKVEHEYAVSINADKYGYRKNDGIDRISSQY